MLLGYGMIRVMGAGADVARLENAQIVSADTVLGSLALADGDAIQASDNQTAIRRSARCASR